MNIIEVKSDPCFISACKKYNLDPTHADAANNVIWMPSQKRGLIVFMDTCYKVIDTDIDIVSNPKYKTQMQKLGIDSKNFYLFENVIVIATPKPGYYCLMDRNFNIFWIGSIESTHLEPMAKFLYDTYSSSLAFEDANWTLPQPFDCLSFQNIMTVASKIDGINSKDFHLHDKRKLFIGLEKKLYTSEKEDIYGELLSLLKYLNLSANFYTDKIYPLILNRVVTEGQFLSNGAYLITLVNALLTASENAIKGSFDVDYKDVLNILGQYSLIPEVESFMPCIMNLFKKIKDGSLEISEVQNSLQRIVTKLMEGDKEWRTKDGHPILLSNETLESHFQSALEPHHQIHPTDKK
ncbi:MAG TPA: hypothetical protein DCY94_05170 [Firmicutes bacterium]|nr:hypothetical protein [Bacillota bacterium]